MKNYKKNRGSLAQETSWYCVLFVYHSERSNEKNYRKISFL